MKKTLISLVAVGALFLSLAACGEPVQPPAKPAAVFGAPAAQYINALNAAISNSNEAGDNVDLNPIPEYKYGGEPLEINGSRLTLDLKTDALENIESIQLYWYSGDNNENVQFEAAFLVGMTAALLTPNDAEEVGEKIFEIAGQGQGATKLSRENITYDYEASASGANRLIIAPAEK